MEEIWASIQKTVQPAFQQMTVFAVELLIAIIVFLIGWQITQYVQRIARRALYRRDQETDARLFAAVHRLILIGGVGLSAAAALLVMGIYYTSDLRKAHAVILQAVSDVTGVLSDPAPSVTLDKFEPLFVHATARYWLNWQATDAFVVLTAMSQAIVEAAQREGSELFLQPQKVVDAL